jgi:sodium transport system ATP-binding protein
LLIARNLCKSYADAGRGMVRAVDDLSFTAQPGEVYGLLGPNGAGKTTTLRMLCTLTRPDSGSIEVAGVDAIAEPTAARGKLAYVPAEAGLPGRLTPREVVTLFARVQGVASPGARAVDLLRDLGALPFADSPCASLSTGQKRRVVLARALVHDPPVLLLDEPTDGLDVAGRREVLGLLRRLAAAGHAVVLSSHIMGEVEQVCGRAGVVSRGRLVAEGSLADLRDQAGTTDLNDAFMHLVGEGGA